MTAPTDDAGARRRKKHPTLAFVSRVRRRYFGRFDADKDGVLRKEEIRMLAKTIYDGRDCPENTLRKFLQVARGFELKDKITFADFKYFARCARVALLSTPRPYQPDVCSEK